MTKRKRDKRDDHDVDFSKKIDVDTSISYSLDVDIFKTIDIEVFLFQQIAVLGNFSNVNFEAVSTGKNSFTEADILVIAVEHQFSEASGSVTAGAGGAFSL